MKSILSGLKINQIRATDHIKGWKVGALFMEAGTGKTRVALEIVYRSPCDAVIWIGPLRTLENTKQEIGKWGGFRIPAYYFGIESIQQSDRIYMEMLDVIQSYKNPFVVIDESLKIKNAQSKRTRRMLHVGSLVEYKLILNGTPISRNMLDLWAQMEFLSPLILGMTHTQFKDTFCEYTIVERRSGYRRSRREIITGYANVDYLYSLIRPYVYQCELSLQILQNYHYTQYELTPQEKATYQAIKEEFLSYEFLDFYNNNIFMGMTQKMQHSYCCSPSKIEAVKSIFQNIPEEKTIIFCKFVDSRNLCETLFPKAKVLSYQKESLGLNLQQYCHTIFFDKVWDYALMTQSTRRTYRTGQKEDCHYYDLTGDVGLESLIDRNINRKVSISEYFKKATKKDLKKDL